MGSFLCLGRSQLRRSEQSQPITEEIANRNETSAADSVAASRINADFVAEVGQDFRVAEDTSTWSSIAITRENVQIDTSANDANLNNNLTVPRIRRNSSVESLADYEGK